VLFPVLHKTNTQSRHIERNGSPERNNIYNAGNVSTQPKIQCTEYNVSEKLYKAHKSSKTSNTNCGSF
jgi:hypothetical protein